MRKAFLRLYEIIWRRDIEYAEIQGSLIALLWGAWFLQQYYDVSFKTKLPVYNSLLKVATHEAWGVTFIVIGLIQFFGLLFSRYTVRRIGTMSATVLWLFVGIFLAMDEWRTFSCPTAFAFALGSAWGFIRIGQTHVIAERQHRLAIALSAEKKGAPPISGSLRTMTAGGRLPSC
jgi:hypothetical protein